MLYELNIALSLSCSFLPVCLSLLLHCTNLPFRFFSSLWFVSRCSATTTSCTWSQWARRTRASTSARPSFPASAWARRRLRSLSTVSSCPLTLWVWVWSNKKKICAAQTVKENQMWVTFGQQKQFFSFFLLLLVLPLTAVLSHDSAAGIWIFLFLSNSLARLTKILWVNHLPSLDNLDKQLANRAKPTLQNQSDRKSAFSRIPQSWLSGRSHHKVKSIGSDSGSIMMTRTLVCYLDNKRPQIIKRNVTAGVERDATVFLLIAALFFLIPFLCHIKWFSTCDMNDVHFTVCLRNKRSNFCSWKTTSLVLNCSYSWNYSRFHFRLNIWKKGVSIFMYCFSSGLSLRIKDIEVNWWSWCWNFKHLKQLRAFTRHRGKKPKWD